jgi:hypothetical protein
MNSDDEMLTPAERRAAEELRRALHDLAAVQPVRVDSGAFVATPRRRGFGARWPLGLAAFVAVALLATTVLVALPRQGSEGGTLPGTVGHYDDGQLSFDYPSDWAALGAGGGSTTVEYVLAVLGNGTWRENCQSGADGSMSWMNCGTDIVEVPPGGIVVKVYRWYGGPPVECRGDTQANATLGQWAARKTVKGDVTSWEIRDPGNEFGQPNNIFVEAHTSDPNQLVRAEALVRSLHFGSSDLGPGMSCDSPSAGLSTTAP